MKKEKTVQPTSKSGNSTKPIVSRSAQLVEMKAKCICCGKIEKLTAQQITDAQQSGAAISSCCYFPMTIESVSAKGHFG